jgi:NADH:ubiquinone oxidoreductase subunit 6 (subunit J)
MNLAGKSGPNLVQWIGIIIAAAIVSAVLFLIALFVIIGGHRFTAGAKFLWIFGVLPWPIIGPLVYLLVGRHMKFIKASVRAQEDAAPAIEAPPAKA